MASHKAIEAHKDAVHFSVPLLSFFVSQDGLLLGLVSRAAKRYEI